MRDLNSYERTGKWVDYSGKTTDAVLKAAEPPSQRRSRGVSTLRMVQDEFRASNRDPFGIMYSHVVAVDLGQVVTASAVCINARHELALAMGSDGEYFI